MRSHADSPGHQSLILGWDRPTLDEPFRALLREHAVGGVLLRGEALGSPASVKRLVEDLQGSARGLPLWIALEHEGGTCQEWGPPHVEVLPSAAEMAVEVQDEIFEITLEVLESARTLAAVGINLALAPCLATGPAEAHGGRCFAVDPERVGAYGAAFVEALHAAGVIACGGPFPGFDDQSASIAPFGAALAHGLEMVQMSAAAPARRIAELRDELGFGGPLLSAVLGGAATERAEGMISSLATGCDVVVLAPAEAAAHGHVLAAFDAALADGRLVGERLQRSMARIVAIKHGWLV